MLLKISLVVVSPIAAGSKLMTLSMFQAITKLSFGVAASAGAIEEASASVMSKVGERCMAILPEWLAGAVGSRVSLRRERGQGCPKPPSAPTPDALGGARPAALTPPRR